MINQANLDRVVAAIHQHGHVHEVALGVMEGGHFAIACRGAWHGQAVGPQTPFLIASTTKLFTTAMIFQLVAEGRLTLETPVATIFDGEIDGLHVLGGTDYTSQITIRQLLSHSSGLADYFEGKRTDGTTLAAEMLDGRDSAYGLADVARWVRDRMEPAFPPGSGQRALYSDTNFYLLSEIIARVGGEDNDTALARRSTEPLGLERTSLYKPGTPTMPLRNGDRIVDIPLSLASMPGDGGIVSCLEDLTRFTRAFFEGALFPKAFLDDLAPWRRVFFPLRAGTGVLRFGQPRWLPPFQRGLDFIGHSGISGALAYICPERGRIIVGTVNQLRGRGRPYRMMIKAALA